MGTTNYDTMDVDALVTDAITANGITVAVPTGSDDAAFVQFLEETVAYSAFTDGGSTSGTYDLTTGTIPAGAFVLGAYLTALTGFTGDTSAVLTVGDGTDVDRYNTGTPSVFTTSATGLDLGVPSGAEYHAAAATVTLTVTSNADFTSVSAGSLTIRIAYIV